MDISQLWSTHPGIVVGIAVAINIVVAIVVCCCCCCCCGNRTPRKSAYRYHATNRVTPSDLESGPLNGFEQLLEPPKPRTKGDYTLVVTDDPEDDLNFPQVDPDFPAPTVSINQERPRVQLPHDFNAFIINKIIPDFNGQRSRGYQFAVVVLLSENDLDNICQTTLTPSDSRSGKPILDNSYSTMPQDGADYGNYIVARPISNSYHSEEALFGLNSVINSPFNHLWNAYVKHNGSYPKCILLYSWNLPCSRCTDVIIRSLQEEPYNRVSVIVAHTQVWMFESFLDQNKCRNKLHSNNITVQQIGYPIHIPPAS